MKREVWSLINQDDRYNYKSIFSINKNNRRFVFSESVPIVPTDTKSGGNSYARWIKHSSMTVRPWQWTPFTNSARGPNDTFVLYHWQHKLDQNEPAPEYPFAKFNKVNSRTFSSSRIVFIEPFLACRCSNIYRYGV